jgi:nitric oxide reductase subunit B
MVLLSMFPIGIMQAWASIEHGTWYARSSDFLQLPLMQSLRWMRVPGDVLFATGCMILGLFVIGLLTGHSYRKLQDASIPVEENEKEHALIAGD